MSAFHVWNVVKRTDLPVSSFALPSVRKIPSYRSSFSRPNRRMRFMLQNMVPPYR